MASAKDEDIEAEAAPADSGLQQKGKNKRKHFPKKSNTSNETMELERKELTESEKEKADIIMQLNSLGLDGVSVASEADFNPEEVLRRLRGEMLAREQEVDPCRRTRPRR